MVHSLSHLPPAPSAYVRVLALSACVAATAYVAEAQTSPTLLAPTLECPRCTHELIPVVTIGDADGPGSLSGEPKFLLRLPDGRYVTAEYPTATRLLVFKANGTFDRTVGREGEGPGEFMNISAAYVTSAGRLRVFDLFLRRETEFDANLSYLRSTNRTDLAAYGISAGPDENVYYNADISTPEAIGLPIHTIAAGRERRSFGTHFPIRRPDAPEMGQRAMVAVAGGVWTARRTHYLIEFWRSDGVRTAALERRINWFAPYLMRAALSPDEPPQPWVAALGNATTDRLIALVHVAAHGFVQGLRPIGQRGNRTMYDLDDCSQVFDTIIESIDFARKRVVSSSRRSECLLGFVGNDVYGYSLDRGVPRVNVFGLRAAVRTQ